MEFLVRNSIFLIIALLMSYEAVTVNPLCPTNKIAPHRRTISRSVSSRTFGTYYDLLTPSQGGSRPPSQYQDPLQEQPQEDDPDDCGDIEDYDENDLTALSQQNRRRQDLTDSRFFFGIFNRPPQHLPPYRPPEVTSNRPGSHPQRPQGPNYHSPPYGSGGMFGNNVYRPPIYQNPSDHYKPVYEPLDYYDAPQTYRPQVVGGPLGHVVGVTQARPTSPSPIATTRRRPDYVYNLRPDSTQQHLYTTRRPRTRKFANNKTVIGSFIELFSK